MKKNKIFVITIASLVLILSCLMVYYFYLQKNDGLNSEITETNDNNFEENVSEISVENAVSFVAKVLEKYDKSILVEPDENEYEFKSSDRIVVGLAEDMKNNNYVPGDKVVVRYSGNIMETYPAQISAYKVEKVK